ncbi:MAG TPA: DUF2007 domain-containing protein [Kofleriaceae bacterium]
MSGRVRIGTCSNPADAALVRSVFAAHELGVVIGAEHHASLLGPLGGAFLSLDIWVAEQDAEEAWALLHDLRERGAGTAPDAGDGDGDDDDDEVANGCADEAAGLPAVPSAPVESLRWRLDRRRRTLAVLLLGSFLTFGTAHLFARAWLRGFALAGLEILGFRYLAAGNALGRVMVTSAIVCDLVGAVWRVRATPRTTLPVARIHQP